LGSSESSEEIWEEVVKVDLVSLMKLCKLAVPHIEQQPCGAIINLSSLAGRQATKGRAPCKC